MTAALREERPEVSFGHEAPRFKTNVKAVTRKEEGPWTWSCTGKWELFFSLYRGSVEDAGFK